MYNGNELKKKLINSSVLKRFKDNNIKHLYLVGSFARGEEKEDSDIDLVYEMSEKGYNSGLDFIKMKLELQENLDREIDLVEGKFINKRLEKYIEDDKIKIF